MCTSKPKMPPPQPVIERQAYKSAPSRDSLVSDGDPNARRRAAAGVETSAQGLLDTASTTRRVKAGGDSSLLPGLTGGPSAPVMQAVASLPTNSVRGGQPKTAPLTKQKVGLRALQAFASNL